MCSVTLDIYIGHAKKKYLGLTRFPTYVLIGDLSKLKETPFTIKEGAEYKLKITFRVSLNHLFLSVRPFVHFHLADFYLFV
jgi:hypothetical protein